MGNSETERALERGEQGERLRNLLEVVRWHQQAKGEPVKLNGVTRCWNMQNWDCETAACAFGSYALSVYGQEFFEPRLIYRSVFGTGLTLHDFQPRGFDPSKEEPRATCVVAVEHFGITLDEAEWLFNPGDYHTPSDIPPHKVIRRIKAVMRRYGHEERQR